ncbi:MAG TPA: DUF3299 domain-containing protein [Opitutaceae bacterium]|nr:DUF3299 domain-containing protein [Opitutaceae bacterium]
MNPFWHSPLFARVVLFAVFHAFGAAAVWAAEANAATNSSSASPAGAPVPAVGLAQSPPESENGYLKLSFDRLASFPFVPPAFDAAAGGKPVVQTGEEQIPPAVKSWNNKKAVITGFMMPVKMEKGLVTEFLVMRNTLACCYGGVPSINEWVVVKMKKGGLPVMVDVPMAFYGELRVGAIFDNGYLSGIYQLDCERMADVKS